MFNQVEISNSCAKLLTVAVRDGDGWVECRCGDRHWGKHGAAGLLIFRDDEVLLQHRAPWVHNGDTWGIPGGARDSHESSLDAALRESFEEIGIDTSLVMAMFSHLDDHVDWRYETIVARVMGDLGDFQKNHETLDLKWFKLSEVGSTQLHPSFSRSWPRLKELLLENIN